MTETLHDPILEVSEGIAMTVRTCDLVAELTVLREAMAVHKRTIMEAYAAKEAAEVQFSSVFGCAPWECPEYAPGWVAAKERVESLQEEQGYYWVQSRVRDLEMMTGAHTGQLPLRSGPTEVWSSGRVWTLAGETPKAHASVWPWLVAKMEAA